MEIKNPLYKKILCIIGTRPEVIKMGPIIEEFKKRPNTNVTTILTGQHRELLDQSLSLFNINPLHDLNLMQPNQSLTMLTARLLETLDGLVNKTLYDVVLAQGDTTSLFVAALISFYKDIPFGHVEAGLRTFDRRAPFPEEINRALTSRLTTYHFAPTEVERNNLLAEGILAQDIYITGNTSIDSILKFSNQPFDFPESFNFALDKKFILLTCHRRENFGKNFLQICRAIRDIASYFPHIPIIYPLHPNPHVRDIAQKELTAPNIHLIKPLDYLTFVHLMKKATLILTDSGGIQEEAPALGKPVLVLREKSERVTDQRNHSVKLVGVKSEEIFSHTKKLLEDLSYYQAMACPSFFYGDGHAAKRIVDIILNHPSLS